MNFKTLFSLTIVAGALAVVSMFSTHPVESRSLASVGTPHASSERSEAGFPVGGASKSRDF